MGWFQRGARVDGDTGRAGLVGVAAAGPNGGTAGAGALLTPRTVLTCAHVVNVALGEQPFESRHPGEVTLGVTFPVAGPDRHPARLALWVAPRDRTGGPVPEGAREWAGDLALLELDEEPPAAVRPLPWRRMVEGLRVRSWYGAGQQFSYANGEVGACDDLVGYVDGRLSGAAVGHGYSGGPLWCAELGAAVGLVAGQVAPPQGAFHPQHVMRRSWAIPWQGVHAQLEAAGAGPLLAAGPDAPSEDPRGTTPAGADLTARHKLLGPLTVLLGDPAVRADRAREVAARCGLRAPDDGSAPGLEELAAVLAREPRALATLTGLLAPAVDAPHARHSLDQLLAHGRVLGPAWLLSHDEHRLLLDRLELLTGTDTGLLPRALRGALPYLDLPGPLRAPHLGFDAVPAAVAALEQFPGDSTPVPSGSPRVPALLRVVEYLAAARGGAEAAALQDWCSAVAARLGVHHSALLERRADAAQWAERAAAERRPRVVVRLQQVSGDPEGTYRCTLWQGRDDDSAARLSTGDDHPRTAPEVAGLVRDAVEAAAGDSQRVPTVEFVVDRGGLHWPVDEWEDADPDDIVPAALGEDCHVLLRCPELRRRARGGESELRRRWARRHDGAPLVLGGDHHNVRALAGELRTTWRDRGRVVLHGPREQRSRLLEVCLALGVPVVLWDREAADEEHSCRLDAVAPTGSLEGLPERVRCFRVKAFTDPAQHPARPALVWEDADRPLPHELRLADPGR
ncbi:hypothetical protein AQ490_01260 [Wenjunlia vitaminophila]|uniref:vWA-MoxR associated protein C-terminal domain-containing protein n=1 Tax=Wenjunlia vitaminophila TaxID=76728 RepID=A0A0T6LYZ5_WENVI|nr:trypsin-like peptidase domain-containing protein [Wenjunlia vitaminophila]KRV51415.1 hypothetical protein AQ490_01260 [Wenjunlia vitaminophila]